MAYVRGNDKDFNRWHEFGKPTWDYENVLPYFKKFEGMQVADIFETDGFSYYHNKNGPVKINLYRNNDALKSVIIEASKELGYKYLKDINANDTIGVTLAHGTIDENRRCTTAKAYLVQQRIARIYSSSNMRTLRNSKLMTRNK